MTLINLLEKRRRRYFPLSFLAESVFAETPSIIRQSSFSGKYLGDEEEEEKEEEEYYCHLPLR